MHTSLEVYPRAHCVSCEGACPTVPSPLVGEGQGEGWRRLTGREACPDASTEAGCICLLDRRYRADAVRVVPLSLSLPHKGGGNAVALLCPTLSQHSRIRSQMCACLSAFAGTNGDRHRGFGKMKPTRRSGKTKPMFPLRRRAPHASPISRRISAVCSPSRGEGRGDATGLPPIMIGVRTPGILPSLASALASSSRMPRWITCGSAKT